MQYSPRLVRLFDMVCRDTCHLVACSSCRQASNILRLLHCFDEAQARPFFAEAWILPQTLTTLYLGCRHMSCGGVPRPGIALV
jgi:hypothetical protein